MESKTAKARLCVLSGHLGRSNEAINRDDASIHSIETRETSESESSWEKEVEELRNRRQLALERSEADVGIKRQREAGKLIVRERVAQFLDEGSLIEFGSIAGKVVYTKSGDQEVIKSFTPANFVSGRGKVDGRPVVVGADDFTVRGGHADGAIWRKSMYAEQLAREFKIPMVRLIDGSSGGGSVAMILDEGRTYVPPLPGFNHLVALLSEVPVATAVLGPAVGLGAARATMCHFSVIAEGVGQLFAAGPPVVEAATHKQVTKEELGGARLHTENGSIDNLASNEQDCFVQIRRFLSYLPSNVYSAPPRIETDDPTTRRDEELLSAIPRRRQRPYDVRMLFHHIFDRSSFFEIGKQWGRSIVVGFARLDGYSVGVIASDPTQGGGVLSAQGSEKLRRHIDLCETFHVPVVSLVDMPGFAIGIPAEKAATIRKGNAAIMALYQATIPFFSVIIRRAFGVAGAAMVDHGDPNVRVAWPSGDWGSLPLEGGVEAAYKRQLSQAPDPAKLREEILEKFEAVRSPFRTAENFGIEEIIDPRDTRPMLCEWVKLIYPNRICTSETLQQKKITVYRP